MPARILAVISALLVVGSPTAMLADAADAAVIDAPVASTAAATTDTINDFLPEDRAISDCISALPKPGCGSEARGGWHQYLVAIAMFGGVTIVGWRIIAGVRRR